MENKLSNLALNCWLAEHLFGFEWWRSSKSGRRALLPPDRIPDWFHERADGTEDTCFDHPSHVPNYSESETHVWKVIHQCAKKGIHLFINSHNNLVIPYTIEAIEGQDGNSMNLLTFGSFSETLPRSICEAAKEAVEKLNSVIEPPVLDLAKIKKIKGEI